MADLMRERNGTWRKTCDCGVCRRCKARLEARYRRARNKGGSLTPRPIAPACECGECLQCRNRVYSREYRDRQREAAARGEQLPVSKSQQKANATKARKEARRAEWAAEALARRSTPLSPAQRAEVQELIREALEEDFVG